MSFIELNLWLGLGLSIWVLIDIESVLLLGSRIDGYLTLAWKWATIAPSYVRMKIVTYLMWRKMRRQFKVTNTNTSFNRN